jgi:hypothetical protein
MIWFYEHDGRFRRLEVYPEGTHYRLVVASGDVCEKVEDYDEYDALIRRTAQLESKWKGEGWKGPYGRDTR